VSTLWERPVESLWGLAIVVVGILAYLWWRRDSRVAAIARAPPA
jgi:uncharacterized iron-regulated membrane protein